MTALEQAPTAYEILGVHPSAPTELISACYWAMAGDLQKKRATEPEADAALHLLTRVYESISDPARRAEYNLSANGAKEPLVKRALPRQRFFPLRLFRRNRYALKWYVDPHEVLGLHPRAPQGVVSTAYRLMRDVYLRLPPGSRRQETLLNLLDESYAVLRDPQRRAQLAGVGTAEEYEPQPPAPDEPPVSDLPEPSQPDEAAAKVALPMPAPAPIEPPKPQKTALPIPPSGPVASTAGPKDGGAARRAAVAIVAFAAVAAGTVARGIRWVVMAVAATSVVVAGGVVTAVHWAVLAVAALTMAAARFAVPYARSGWLATRRWLRRFWEERRKTRAPRSREASSRPATPDEVFLGRLASTVGKSRTERRPSSDGTTRR